MEVLSSQILFLSAFQESNQRIVGREERGMKIFQPPHREFSLYQRSENRNQKHRFHSIVLEIQEHKAMIVVIITVTSSNSQQHCQ